MKALPKLGTCPWQFLRLQPRFESCKDRKQNSDVNSQIAVVWYTFCAGDNSRFVYYVTSSVVGFDVTSNLGIIFVDTEDTKLTCKFQISLVTLCEDFFK